MTFEASVSSLPDIPRPATGTTAVTVSGIQQKLVNIATTALHLSFDLGLDPRVRPTPNTLRLIWTMCMNSTYKPDRCHCWSVKRGNAMLW